MEYPFGSTYQQAATYPSAAHRANFSQGGQQYAQDGLGGQHYDDQQPGTLREEPFTISMTVPEGAAPGTKLQCSAPDGQELRLTVPDGVPPGSVMTLTRDPVSKGWKCMAEPADTPPILQPLPQEPEVGQHLPQANYGQVRSAGPTASYGSNAMYPTAAPAVASPAKVSHAAAAPTYSSVNYAPPQQMRPVNLSYVPPSAVQTSSIQALPQVVMHQGGQAPGQPPTYAIDPANFNPPRMMPGHAHPEAHQSYEVRRPSYTPPPVAIIEQQQQPRQNASYTPPPVVVLEQRPSYAPPPQAFLGHQMGHIDTMGPTTRVPMGMMPGMPPAGMVLPGRTPSYTPPPAMPGPMPMGGPSITSMPGMPMQHMAPPAPEIVMVNGQQLPIMQEQILRTWHPQKLREHAAYLHRSLGQERIGMLPPQYDHELGPWIVNVQRAHLEPLRGGPMPGMPQAGGFGAMPSMGQMPPMGMPPMGTGPMPMGPPMGPGSMHGQPGGLGPPAGLGPPVGLGPPAGFGQPGFGGFGGGPPQMGPPGGPGAYGQQGMQGMPHGMQGMSPGMQGMPPGMQGMQGAPGMPPMGMPGPGGFGAHGMYG